MVFWVLTGSIWFIYPQSSGLLHRHWSFLCHISACCKLLTPWPDTGQSAVFSFFSVPNYKHSTKAQFPHSAKGRIWQFWVSKPLQLVSPWVFYHTSYSLPGGKLLQTPGGWSITAIAWQNDNYRLPKSQGFVELQVRVLNSNKYHYITTHGAASCMTVFEHNICQRQFMCPGTL